MITLTKSGNAIVFTFDDNDHYLNDGIIEVPVNSLTLVTDESQMATFRKAASNDIFISATYDELGMSKADLESWFKENAFDTGGVTEEWVEEYVSESISGKADTSDVQNVASDVATVSGDVSTLSGAVESNHNAITALNGDVSSLSGDVANKADTTAVTASINAAVSGKMDTSVFNTYSASTDARISEDEEVTSAALNELNDALDDKADTSAVTASIAAAVSGKQDTLVSGTNIKTINNESLLGSGNITIEAGGNNVIELTQAQYDALTDIDPDAFYIITDADGGVTTGQVQTMIDDSISGKADTSAVTEAVSSKMDTSSFNIYSANTDARLAEDEEVTAAGLNALNDALSGKQDTLSAGTNITISGNVISAEGGGKAISAGTNISVTTGATADTINCTLPISVSTNNRIKISNHNNNVYSNDSIIVGGSYNAANADHTHVGGRYNSATNEFETAFGNANISNKANTTYGNSGNTLLSVGNGVNSSIHHNALEIRQNGDVYIPNTDDTTYSNYYQKPMYRLQDLIVAMGGLKLVQLTQAEYDALTTKDSSILYIITGSN